MFLTGTLLLNFDEPVHVQSLRSSAITISSAPGPTSSVAYVTLSSGSGKTNSSNGQQLILSIDQSDLNALKQNESLAASKNSTYLSYTSYMIADMANNSIPSVQLDSAIEVDVYLPDITVPRIRSFGLDLSAEPAVLTINFDEVVDLSSLQLGKITLQREFSHVDNSSRHQLQPTAEATLAMANIDTTFLQVHLSQRDSDSLKLKRIGSTATSAFIVCDSGVIMDMFGLQNAPITSGVDSIQMSNEMFVADTTQPRLNLFDINMNTGISVVTKTVIGFVLCASCHMFSLLNIVCLVCWIIDLFPDLSMPHKQEICIWSSTSPWTHLLSMLLGSNF